jgi:hypothetical protein
LRPRHSAPGNENQAICAKRTCVRLDKGNPISQDAALPMSKAIATPPTTPNQVQRRTAKKPRCEDCFFHQNMLCALEEKTPCPTFRPAHPDGLRPPRQLAFVFRHQRRPDLLYEPTRV